MWFQKHKQFRDETNRLLKQLSEKAEKLQRQADSLSGQQADSAEMLKQTLNRVSQQMSSLEQRYGESIVMTDVNPYTLGVRVVTDFTMDYMSVIIPRNVTIPATKHQVYRSLPAKNPSMYHFPITKTECSMYLRCW